MVRYCTIILFHPGTIESAHPAFRLIDPFRTLQDRASRIVFRGSVSHYAGHRNRHTTLG